MGKKKKERERKKREDLSPGLARESCIHLLFFFSSFLFFSLLALQANLFQAFHDVVPGAVLSVHVCRDAITRRSLQYGARRRGGEDSINE